MVRRDAVAVGVGGEVVEAQRRGFGDEQPQDASSGWSWANERFRVIGQSDGDELVESGARFVENPRAP